MQAKRDKLNLILKLEQLESEQEPEPDLDRCIELQQMINISSQGNRQLNEESTKLVAFNILNLN